MKIKDWEDVVELARVLVIRSESYIFEKGTDVLPEDYAGMGKIHMVYSDATSVLDKLSEIHDLIHIILDGTNTDLYIKHYSIAQEKGADEYDVYFDLQYEFWVNTLDISDRLKEFISQYDSLFTKYRSSVSSPPDEDYFSFIGVTLDFEKKMMSEKWERDQIQSGLEAIDIAYGLEKFQKNMQRAHEIITNRGDLSEILDML